MIKYTILKGEEAELCIIIHSFLSGPKVERAAGQLQEMACHSRGQVGVEIADVLETYASFRELILKGS